MKVTCLTDREDDCIEIKSSKRLGSDMFFLGESTTSIIDEDNILTEVDHRMTIGECVDYTVGKDSRWVKGKSA